MFKSLNAAIALEVHFQYEKHELRFQPGNIRKLYIANEVEELRKNSGFDTEAEFRLITADFVVEAILIKLDALRRSIGRTGWTVHYTNGAKPHHCKTDYKLRGPAERAAAKLNAGRGGGYTASTTAAYVAATRGKIVINMMSRKPVMETTGTNYSCSVASEAYWSN
jgi:hypothetical protein